MTEPLQKTGDNGHEKRFEALSVTVPPEWVVMLRERAQRRMTTVTAIVREMLQKQIESEEKSA